MIADTDKAEPPALPWTTPPTDLGSATCAWCGRDIHAPAVPCSVAPVDGLAEMATSPGMGERCQWELRTRGVTGVGVRREALRASA